MGGISARGDLLAQDGFGEESSGVIWARSGPGPNECNRPDVSFR